MVETGLDVGFVPVETPGTGKTGATNTSTLLIEELSKRHELTVYVSSQRAADPATLPAADRVEYVLHDGLSMLPHPMMTKLRALRPEKRRMERHDLVHSYSSGFIPVLADLSVPTLVSLNSYLPVCPKADFRYHGTSNCTGPGLAKCLGCIPATAVNRRQGVVAELKSAYLAIGRAPMVGGSIDRCNDIDAYHALSDHIKADYASVGFPRDRITVIPHFVDDAFRTTPTPGRPATGEPYRLLYVGALQDIKGVEVLIGALPEIERRCGSVELTIIGNGPMRDRLTALADDLGVNDRIVWEGHLPHDELPNRYRQADVFVYPGVLNEPFGRVILEALASYTPVLSSDVGSMASIIGEAGRTFVAGDSTDLARSLTTLLDSYPTHVDAIGGRLERFSKESVLDAFDTLYFDTAGKAAATLATPHSS